MIDKLRQKKVYDLTLQRKQKIQKWIDFYNGNQLYYTRRKINQSYDSVRQKLILKQKLYITNITKSIINKLSILFQSGILILIANNEDATKMLQNTIKKSGLYNMLTTLNVMTNLCYDTHIMLRYDELDKIVRCQLLTPLSTFVWQNLIFPQKADAIAYIIGLKRDTISGNVVNKVILWTKLYYVTCLILSNGLMVLLTLRIPNPYNKIPLIHFADSYRYDTYFSLQNQIVVLKNLSLNCNWSLLRAALTYQAMSILVITGALLKEDIEAGIGSLIYMPVASSPTNSDVLGDAKYINANAPLTLFLTILKSMLTDIAQQYGINADIYRSTTNASSGYQLALSRQDLINYNIEDIPLYLLNLRSVVKLMMLTLNIYSGNSLKWSQEDMDNLSVIINEPKFLTDLMLLLALLLKMIAMNISSPILYIMKKYNLNLADATLKYNKYYADNNKMHLTLVLPTNIDLSMIIELLMIEL